MELALGLCVKTAQEKFVWGEPDRAGQSRTFWTFWTFWRNKRIRFRSRAQSWSLDFSAWLQQWCRGVGLYLMNVTLQRGDREPEPEPESLLSADFTQRPTWIQTSALYSEVIWLFIHFMIGQSSFLTRWNSPEDIATAETHDLSFSPDVYFPSDSFTVSLIGHYLSKWNIFWSGDSSTGWNRFSVTSKWMWPQHNCFKCLQLVFIRPDIATCCCVNHRSENMTRSISRDVACWAESNKSHLMS